jgi:Zinc finger, C2H2 type
MRFSVFKKDLIEKQRRLYDLLNAKKNKNEILVDNFEEISSDEDIEVSDHDQDVLSIDSELETIDAYESSYDAEHNSDEELPTHANFKNKVIKKLNSEPRGKFVCDHCNSTFKAKQGLTRHVQSHIANNLSTWSCNQCHFVAGSKNQLRNHKKYNHKLSNIVKSANTGHTDRYKCFCGSCFATISALKTHKTRRHGELKSCNYGCNKNFDSIGEWIRHIRTLHPKYEKECLLMVKASKNNEWYTDSMMDEELEAKTPERKMAKDESEDEKNNSECPECFKLFATPQSLHLHMDTIHHEIKM